MRNALVFLLLSSVFVTAAEIRISVQFDPDKQEVYGSQWIKFNEPTKEAWFVLLANLGRERNPYVSPLVIDSNYVFGFDPSWTKIETVVWEPTSQPVDYALLPAPPTYQTYSLEDVLMRVKLPGEPGELRIDFRTRFPHVWVEPGRLGDIYTWRFGWHPLLLPSAPGDVLPFALPFHSYSVELVLPEGWRAFLPGNAKAEGTRFSTTFVEPVSSVALYFGPAERFHAFTLACSGWILEGVALPGDEPALRSLLTWIPEILAWYEERFGPYPHRRLLLVEHPTEQGVAMTAEGVVFLPRWFFQRQDLTASGVLTRYGLYILAHELAHLWWGIGVGVDFDAENWLSEGLSQYLSITWYEEKFGAEGGNLFAFDKKGLGEEIVDYALGFVNLREHLTELPYLQVAFYGFDEAVVKPTREVQYDHVSGDRLYNKGYLVLRALAYLLGEDTFHQALRRAASQFRGRTLSVTDFQHLLEAESQRDLSRFFEDWVTGQAWADYGVNGLRQWPAPPGYQVELSLTYRGTGVLPVPLELRGPEGKRKVLVWEPKGTPAEAMVVMSEFPIEQVILDPEHRVLDVDRLNNRWPRRYVVALKNDLPLDGYLVSLDSSGAFSLSYLDRFAFAVYPQELALEGFVNFGQVGYVSAWAQIQDTLVGAITVARTLWLTPRTGSAAKYWEEAGELSFTVGRLPDWVFEVGLAWQESVAHARATDASFLFVPNQGYGLSLSHTELFGLAPNLYPTLTFSLGFASPALSPRFWPTLTELRALSLREEGPPSARHKAAAVLGVWLPPYFPSYSLGQAALVSEARPRVFFAAAQIWNESEERQTFVEVGGELWLTVEALGGLWSASLVLGLSYPLLPEGPVLLYFGLAG